MDVDYIKEDPHLEDIRSRMEVFWIPLFLVHSAYLVSSQPQAIPPVSIQPPTEQKTCWASKACETFFGSSAEKHSLRGFCSHQIPGPPDNINCSLVDSAGNRLCSELPFGGGCACCPECMEKGCSSKGEGYSCLLPTRVLPLLRLQSQKKQKLSG